MPSPDFQDDALVLLAHGSTLNAGSARPAWQQADALRSRGLFAEIHEAFWKQEPFVGGVLRRVLARRIFLVPLFIADGWFTEQVLPRELGLRAPEAAGFPRIQVQGDRTLHYCGAVGSHPSMTEVLLARALGVLSRHPFPRVPRPGEVAVVLVGHGTAYSRGSREAIERQVERIRARNLYAEVIGVYLEEAPHVGDCFELTRARNLVFVPFFISDGLHTLEDLPVLLGESGATVRKRLTAGLPTWANPTERHGRRIWCAPALGSEPLVAEVILERVRESAAGSAAG